MATFLLQGEARDYIWSGRNLKNNWNKTAKSDKIAEVWELSLYPKLESTIISGEFKGKNLAELYLMDKTMFGKKTEKFDRFPILIKLIDAEDNLSIQVHPNDEYSLRVEKELGKTEMWYVLAAEKDAGIYFGCNKNLTKEEFKKSIEENTVTDNLNFINVKQGDAFFIESGTIHAILKGLTIFEVQENSNITYRVYDYGRKDANGNERQLHIDKAIEVSNLNTTIPLPIVNKYEKRENYSFRTLSECEYFKTVEYIQNGKISLKEKDSFIHLMVIDGMGTVDGLTVEKGSSVFISADSECEIVGNLKYIKTTIGGK